MDYVFCIILLPVCMAFFLWCLIFICSIFSGNQVSGMEVETEESSQSQVYILLMLSELPRGNVGNYTMHACMYYVTGLQECVP